MRRKSKKTKKHVDESAILHCSEKGVACTLFLNILFSNTVFKLINQLKRDKTNATRMLQGSVIRKAGYARRSEFNGKLLMSGD